MSRPATGSGYWAPGKLMLAGEYAVLGRGPEALALAVAIDPGVSARAEPAAAWGLARADDGLEWRAGQPVPQGLRFAHAAWALDRASRGAASGAAHRIVTRGSALVGEPAAGKRGVGGSASATVAVTAVLCELDGIDPLQARHAVQRRALAAHRAAQGERGSGYDVVTALWGGLVCWRPNGARGAGQAQTIDWPAGLQLVAAFSGRGARTADFLARVAQLEADDAPGLAAELAQLGRCAQLLVEAMATAALAELPRAVQRCQAELARWDRRRNLGIVTAEVAAMLAIAERLGAAAKISGAGGGDSVIALDDDPARLARLTQAWQAAGFAPLPITRCDAGLQRCWP